VAKQYYGYKNFTRFIRPGCRIIAAGDAQTLAAYDSNTQQLVLVTYNDGNSNRSITYDLSLFSPIGTATPHRTSSTRNLAQLAPVPLTNNQLTVTLPEKSITTYLMRNVTVLLGRGRLDP
jgi:O-glycosyl hydrolase